jgi:NAD(P)-dependent dehydrogenase (short-subunit alcohol dehydrogenase family)
VSKKNVLITGGTSGIGLGIANAISSKYSLVNLSRSKPKKEVAHLFSDFLEIDLSSEEKIIKKTLGILKSRNKVFDGLVCCSGIQKISSIVSLKEKDLLEIFQLNLFSNVFLLKNMLRLGLLSNGASVVFLSSISSENPDIGMSAYSMTKASIDNFVKVAASELSDRQIRVNSIRPGLINTPMISSERAYSENFFETENPKYKLGLGKSEYVANLVEFLISDSGFWITGQNITIDGGRGLS